MNSTNSRKLIGRFFDSIFHKIMKRSVLFIVLLYLAISEQSQVDFVYGLIDRVTKSVVIVFQR